MKNDFKFFLPAEIEKATNPTSGIEVMLVKGIAGTNRKDRSGENLDPSGMDLSEFRWINYNHKGSSDPATIIGEPTKATITPQNELYIEGMLYPEIPMAQTTWNLMKALRNSPSGNKLCLSVEGKVTQRASNDKKNPLYNKILKSKITGVAICPVPVNGDTWVDFIEKGYTDNKNDEELDEETQKAMTAAAGETTTSKEDVETEKNKVETKVTVGVGLKKSEVFERIYDISPSITIEKAKSVYSLIEKIANMKTGNKEVTDETISKAFEILDLAAENISKSADGAGDSGSGQSSNDDEDQDEKELVQKASASCKIMKSEGKTDEVIKSAMIKKGYGEKIIEKAMKDEVSESNNSGISKSELSEILKSQTSSLATVIGEQFKAVGIVLKKLNEENGEIKKSLEDSLSENKTLKEQIGNFLNQPQGQKSLISKSYSARFADDSKEGGDKSKKFNIASSVDRENLKNIVIERSGINKSENYDKGLVSIAQELEIAKSLTPASLSRLKAMEFEIVRE